MRELNEGSPFKELTYQVVTTETKELWSSKTLENVKPTIEISTMIQQKEFLRGNQWVGSIGNQKSEVKTDQ